MKPMVTAPRMPLQPGAMNIPKSGVNMRRIWSGLRGCPREMAKARATCAETRWRGRSTRTLKTWGMGLTNHSEDDGEERSAKETRASEEQDDARSVGEGYERVRGHVDVPRRAEDENEDGLLAEMYGKDGDDEDDGSPPGAIHLEVERAPGTKDENSH